MCDEIGGQLATPNEKEWENLSAQFCPNNTKKSYGADFWLGYEKKKESISSIYDPKTTLPISKPAFPPYGNDNDEQRLQFLAPNAAILAIDYSGWNIASLSASGTPVCEAAGAVTTRPPTTPQEAESTGGDDLYPEQPPYEDKYNPQPYDPNRERGRVQSNGKTYFIYEGSMNYTSARDLCKEKGQKLPIFENTESYLAFRKAIQRRNNNPGRPYYGKRDFDHGQGGYGGYPSYIYVSNFWIGISYKDGGLKGEYDNKPFPAPSQNKQFPPISTQFQNLASPPYRRANDTITYPVKAVGDAWTIQRTINGGSGSSGFLCEFEKC